MKKVKVLIGNYGSGKSELALNFAMQSAARGERTELIDLDMVNTYFRLTERGKMVEQKEIRLVSPNFACSGIETLSLPAEVQSAFGGRILQGHTAIFLQDGHGSLHHLLDGEQLGSGHTTGKGNDVGLCGQLQQLANLGALQQIHSTCKLYHEIFLLKFPGCPQRHPADRYL